MKKYETPKMEVIEFEYEDVITSSSPSEPGGEITPPEDPTTPGGSDDSVSLPEVEL